MVGLGTIRVRMGVRDCHLIVYDVTYDNILHITQNKPTRWANERYCERSSQYIAHGPARWYNRAGSGRQFYYFFQVLVPVFGAVLRRGTVFFKKALAF